MIQKITKFIAGILAAFALIIVFSQTTHAAMGSNGLQLEVPQGSDASLNWSGYVADNSDAGYTAVTGTWTVPQVAAETATTPPGALGQADATWVGIGGVRSQDLIQAGTQAIEEEDGSVTYSAWIEMLPGYSQTVPLKVKSGDSITASITEEAPGEWLITISNNTRNASFSRTVAYDSSQSSAEWVQEMVSNSDGTFRPLDSFGSISFTNAAATVDGESQDLSQLEARPLKMVNASSEALATPSIVGDDNQSFSVARTDVPANAAMTEQSGIYSLDGIPVTITIIGL